MRGKGNEQDEEKKSTSCKKKKKENSWWWQPHLTKAIAKIEVTQWCIFTHLLAITTRPCLEHSIIADCALLLINCKWIETLKVQLTRLLIKLQRRSSIKTDLLFISYLLFSTYPMLAVILILIYTWKQRNQYCMNYRLPKKIKPNRNFLIYIKTLVSLQIWFCNLVSLFIVSFNI